MDHTTIHPSCRNLAHLIDLHLWRGAPQNRDESRPIQILVNHGYVVGFCPKRLQPAWSAYRVALATRDVDFERPLSYYDDMRLDDELRIGRRTFGKIGNIQLNVGHMTPNEVINRQFGRLAQLETFLMSNMSPQYGSLNSGVWLKLENAIREIKDESGKDHVWAIVGPIFGDDPVSISRGRDKNLPIPEKYFCIVVDPHTYPYDTPSKVAIDYFSIPQTAPRNSHPDDYPSSLAEIERDTNLNFFESWGREILVDVQARQSMEQNSRLMTNLIASRKAATDAVASKDAQFKGDSIEALIQHLLDEAGRISKQGRALDSAELARLTTIQHTISWLIKARDIVGEPSEPEPESEAHIITYKVVADMGDKLKAGARTACNFWNRFLAPKYSIVIRLGTFTANSNTIARAYKPYENSGVRFGRVEFNTTYLGQFSSDEIAGTIIHEIGHTLGIGWDEWDKLFHKDTGMFKSRPVKKLSALAHMEVELTGGPGTALAHWDEDRFDRELMTGYQDQGEYVLPVTIDVMKLFGHEVVERLERSTPLSTLLQDAAAVVFSRQSHALSLNLDYFEETELFEEIPHNR